MMFGLLLGGKHIKDNSSVDFLLILDNYNYNYVYSDIGLDYIIFKGSREICKVDQLKHLKHAAPVILAFWSE